MRHIRSITAALAILGSASAAYADIDGTFCVGPDYLAFELSYSLEPESHRLYVMRFDNPAGWKQLASVDMPYFPSPNMKCEADAIHMATWDAVHSVSLSESNPAELSLRSESKPPGPDEYPDDLGSLSVGMSGAYGQHDFPMPSDDPVYSYVLHVSKAPDPLGRCLLNVRSWVTQLVASEVVDEYEIVALQQPAECGE